MKTFCLFISLLFIPLSLPSTINAQTSDSRPVDSGASSALSDSTLTAGSLPELYTPAPVKNLTAKDNPDDGGGKIILTWDISADDYKEGGTLSKYIIMRSDNPTSGFKIIGVARVGIWVLMLTFGAGFGYTVMARISLLAGRMTYLFGDWLGFIN